MKQILYIHTHDTGRYIEPYGYQVSSPVLMRLAEEGTLFRNAFSVAPTCSPSRTGLLTGRTAHAAGMLGLAHRGFARIDYSQHLVRYLNQQGFKTVLCGMQHVAPKADMIGYDEILCGDKDCNDRENAEKLARYLKQDKGRLPRFISYGMEYTHRPFPETDDTINENYLKPPWPVFDNCYSRNDMSRFLTAVKKADQCVGIIIEALKDSGLEDETLIIFTTDHGPAFPGMKCTLYDSGIAVSLIMKYSGNKLRGRAVDALVSQLDVFPTICDLFELEKPDWLEGYSLLPLFEKEKDRVRDYIFAEINFHAAYEPWRCIRSNRYKYIRYFGEYQKMIPANIDDGPSKDFILKHGYLNKNREEEMLFDLYFDPLEKVNLLEDKDYKDIYQIMSAKLKEWMEETSDPLLNGRVEKPAGAAVNKIDSLSAESGEFI